MKTEIEKSIKKVRKMLHRATTDVEKKHYREALETLKEMKKSTEESSKNELSQEKHSEKAS